MKPDHRDVLICTVQHTGTWTLSHNFSRHPEIGGVKQPPIFLGHSEFKVHDLGSDIVIQERLARSRRQAFLYHIKHINDLALVRACHVIGGLRDPILTLLTARRRTIRSGNVDNVPKTLASITDQWLTLLDWIRSGVEIHLVPVDRPQFRDYFWNCFLLRASLSLQPADWTITNTSGSLDFDDSLLKLYNEEGASGLMKSGEANLTAEVHRLFARESELQSLFTAHGYDWPIA